MNYKLKKKLPIKESPEVGFVVSVDYKGDAKIDYLGLHVTPKNDPEYWEKSDDYVYVTYDRESLKAGELAYPVSLAEGVYPAFEVPKEKAVVIDHPKIIYFANQHVAEDFVITNKPCLSVDEVISILIEKKQDNPRGYYSSLYVCAKHKIIK